MKAHRKDVSKYNMTNEEMETVATACRQFDDLQLTIPILSSLRTARPQTPRKHPSSPATEKQAAGIGEI